MPMCCRSADSMTRYRKRHGIKVVVSQKRIDNLRREFNFVKWNPKSIKITYEGLGDQPVFFIKGKYKRYFVSWQSKPPGGSYARFFIGHKLLDRLDHKRTGFKRATYSRKHEIENWLKTIFNGQCIFYLTKHLDMLILWYVKKFTSFPLYDKPV